MSPDALRPHLLSSLSFSNQTRCSSLAISVRLTAARHNGGPYEKP
jgi:hypothetical protein